MEYVDTITGDVGYDNAPDPAFSLVGVNVYQDVSNVYAILFPKAGGAGSRSVCVGACSGVAEYTYFDPVDVAMLGSAECYDPFG